MIYEAIRKGHKQNANAASVPAENNDIIGRKDILTVNLAMPPHDNAANDGQPLIELILIIITRKKIRRDSRYLCCRFCAKVLRRNSYVEEIPTDVVQGKLPVFFNQEAAGIPAEANAPDINMYRPMVCGIQLCHLHEHTGQYYLLSLGTLGMFVKCKDDPEGLYILTNWHVLEKEAMDIYQPMYSGSKSSLLLAAGERR